MPELDCDDVMLVLANPGHDSSLIEEHLADCPTCRELSEENDDLVGTEIGVYRITELLGAGGMGRVYLAVHPDIESRVAVKVFSKDWGQNPKLVSRFFAEARATNVIGHENIVNVLDVGRLEDGQPYLVMEYLSGQPLSELIGTERLDDALAKQLALDVLSALAAAHERDIVHRDLKPDNIFVSPEGRATLLDFGVAKLVPEIVGEAVTATGTVLGTPHYMSPEQATGEDVDTRTDIYAMGVILYEALLGRRPFSGTSLYRLMEQHVNRTPKAPRRIRPDLDADLESVVLRALAKKRTGRFETASAMKAALESCQVEPGRGAFEVDDSAWETDEAVTVAERPKSRVEPKTSRRALWVVAALALAGAAVMAFALTRGSAPTPTPDAGRVVVVTTPDAGPLDASFDARPLDASIPDAAAKIVKKPVAPTKGTAPLSLLGRAKKLAIANAPDSSLLRVRVAGMNEYGRVPFAGKSSVVFDFYSRTLSDRVTRKNGRCIVRVTFTSKKSPSVSRVSGRCAELQPVAPPSCSMAKLLERHRRNLPKDGDVSLAILQRSRNGNPYWKLVIGGRNFKVGAC